MNIKTYLVEIMLENNVINIKSSNSHTAPEFLTQIKKEVELEPEKFWLQLFKELNLEQSGLSIQLVDDLPIIEYQNTFYECKDIEYYDEIDALIYGKSIIFVEKR